MIGKIHLDGIPQGFDFSMVLPGQGQYYNPDFLVDGKKVRKNGYVTDIITETALDWIKNKRDQDKPFCLLYHQKAPHRNWLPAPEYMHLYDDKTFELPATFYDDYKGRPAAKAAQMRIDTEAKWGWDFKLLVDPSGDSTDFNNVLKRFSSEQKSNWLAAYTPKNDAMRAANLSGRDLDMWKYNRFLKDYLRCIKSVDDGVGELLDYLDKSGLADNTVVIYTSDQGFYLGEHGWFDKRFMYKESFRTPLLVRYPKEIKPGTKIDKLVQNLDFAPTILDYAGVKEPEDMQGESFRNLMSGKTEKFRDFAYYTYYEFPAVHMAKRHYGVATQRYKLMHFYYDIDEWELYDLEKDPSELNNVYNDPAYADVQEMMHKKLDYARNYYGDSDANDQHYLKEYLDVMEQRRQARQASQP